jgi:hypothetical protein
MTQAMLDSAVARATGESLKTIQRRGFSPLPSCPRRSRRRRGRTASRVAATPQDTVISK